MLQGIWIFVLKTLLILLFVFTAIACARVVVKTTASARQPLESVWDTRRECNFTVVVFVVVPQITVQQQTGVSGNTNEAREAVLWTECDDATGECDVFSSFSSCGCLSRLIFQSQARSCVSACVYFVSKVLAVLQCDYPRFLNASFTEWTAFVTSSVCLLPQPARKLRIQPFPSCTKVRGFSLNWSHFFEIITKVFTTQPRSSSTGNLLCNLMQIEHYHWRQRDAQWWGSTRLTHY